MTVVNSYSELIALDHHEFVDAAYQLVLGRMPDETGMIYYSARLRAGYSRLSVLHQLGKGGEPRSWNGLPGLSRSIKRYRISRLPLIGWLFRKLWRVEGETPTERIQRAMISDLTETRSGIAAVRSELKSLQSELRIADIAATQSKLCSAAAAAIAPSFASAPDRRPNLVAEKLSPSAREIFNQLISD